MAGGANNYVFAAQSATDGGWVELEIVDASDESHRYLEKVWNKLSQAVANACECENGGSAPSWTSWKPHEWSKKAVPGRLKFVAWDGPTLAGFLNLRMNLTSAVDKQPIAYVEHVAAFPGNMSTQIWEKRLKGTGMALLAFAAMKGQQAGMDRFGLHADEDAVGWYDRLHAEFGNMFQVRQRGVPGPYNGNQTQLYYETSVAGAQLILDHYSDA